MKRTHVLFQQHAGRMFAAHWKVQGKRVVRDTGAIKTLKEMGLTVNDVRDILYEKAARKEVGFPIIGYRPPAVKFDSTHPDYHEEPCLTYQDHNLLLEGLEQAKVLTNTVELEPGTLPSSLTNKFNSLQCSSLDELSKRIIKSSVLYDAEQKKLPKRTDPDRPAWIFPRDYGITDKRKNLLICNRFIHLCSSVKPDILTKRRILDESKFSVPLKRSGRNILLSLRADLLVTSSLPLNPIVDKNLTKSVDLPDLGSLLPIISLEEEKICKLENAFVFQPGYNSHYLHTTLIHHNETEVENIYETEVTESQILARSLMKTFTFAAAQAHHMYGNEVTDFPVPIVLQCIQTDGKKFHFSVLQLNTVRENGPIHNMYWSLPRIPLYEICDYIDGRPHLEAYNPDVLKWFIIFLTNDG